MTAPNLNVNKAWFCPECESSAITLSPLEGGTCSCRSCGFKGPRSSLAAHVFYTDRPVDADAMVAEMANQMATAVGAPMAQALLPFLVRWGFLVPSTSERQKKLAARYMVNVGAAMLRAIFKTREDHDKERV